MAPRQPHAALRLVFLVFTMANVGLPAPRLRRHFMALIGTFRSRPTAVVRHTGVILSAAYALWLYRKIVFGALVIAVADSIKDSRSAQGLTLRRWWR